MGSLALPASGDIYLHTNGFIYTIEKVTPYLTPLDTLWTAVVSGSIHVVTSELTILEALVKPFKEGNASLVAAFRAVLQQSPDVTLLPIMQAVLERAAHLRATANLKTPDAIHAATALDHGCALFLTNDPAFRRVAGLPVTLLSDVVAP